MHHIIYRSSATEEMSSAELFVLLVQARRINELAGITSALVYSSGQFMQILEGEQPAVTALYELISVDPRHQAVVKLADEPIAARRFASCPLAFREIPLAQMLAVDEYVSAAQWGRPASITASADSLLLDYMRKLVLTCGPERPANE